MTEETLKPGWTKVKFGEVVRLCKDRSSNPEADDIERYVGLEHLEPEDLRVRRWGLVAEGITFTSRFKPGQVLFRKRRAYQRKVAVADFEGVCSGDIYVFESADPKQLLPELLPFICQTDQFSEYAVGTSAGSLSPRTNWKSLQEFEFLLPSLEEQALIIKILISHNSISNELKSALREFEKVKQAQLVNVFGSHKYPKKEWVKFADCSERIGDGTHQPPKFSHSGVPFFLISNISSGYLDSDFSKWVSKESYKKLTKTFRPSRGDVIYTLVGSYGVPVYVDWDWDFVFQRHIGFIRPQKSLLDGKYIYYFLQSLPGLYQANRFAEGLAQKTITLKSLRSFCLPLPSLEDQSFIVRNLEEIDKAINSIRDRREEIAAKQKLLFQKSIGI